MSKNTAKANIPKPLTGPVAWANARRLLGASGTLTTACRSLREQGFSPVEIGAATSAAVARAITAAEDELELRKQGANIATWRLELRAIRRRVE